MADFFLTGASGFIGRHLIERLHRDGHAIRCLVRKESSIMHEYPEIDWIYGDLNNPDRYNHHLGKADYVIHAAGIVSSRRAEEYYRVNVEGTRSLLRACRTQCRSLSRFLFISSIAAIGASSENRLLTESDRPAPETTYGKSKLLAEDKILRYISEIPIVILRPTFVYGPGDTRGLEFLKLLSKQDELISFSIVETASVCYISDVVSACCLALTVPVPSGEIFNISDSHVYTWKQIHTILARVIDELYPDSSEDNFIFKRMFPDDTESPRYASGNRMQRKYWGCSIDKAVTVLGFKPQYTLSAGAYETIKWYRDSNLYNGHSISEHSRYRRRK